MNDRGEMKNKSNFGIAMKLFLGNNRWSRMLRKESGKGDLYSEELRKKLRWMDSLYIPWIAWIAGALICLAMFALGLGSGTVMIILAVFTLVDIFLISPLLYIAFLPKPLCDHVKSADSLDEDERKTAEEHVRKDEHQEKLMKKYSSYSDDEFDSPMDYIKKINK